MVLFVMFCWFCVILFISFGDWVFTVSWRLNVQLFVSYVIAGNIILQNQYFSYPKFPKIKFNLIGSSESR